MTRNDGEIVTCVYRKPTWSGLYFHFLSFVPKRYKINLVFGLFDRARRLCSPMFLSSEVELLKKTLLANGYPEDFIEKHSAPKSPRETYFGPEKMRAFLRIPFIGDAASMSVVKRLNSTVASTFPAAEARILFTTTPIGGLPPKDPISLLSLSNCVYKFTCECGSTYVGRTERRLGVRIGEHLPKWLKEGSSRPRSTSAPNSAITRHAMSCSTMDRRTLENNFSIIQCARHPRMLPFLEAVFILQTNPDLCKQKDFLFTLKLPWS